MENKIGLDSAYANDMAEKLNAYLSNVQVVYMNVRGYHWNVTGKHFFVLHEKFEELYNALNEMADEVAERILMLGGSPVHAFSKYLKLAKVPEKENVSSSEDTVKEVVSELKHLLEDERSLIDAASENGDEGTVNMLSEYIDSQEKMIWMFSALLK
ncbi:MAG: Dps family protein [Bacteroidota bacterium]